MRAAVQVGYGHPRTSVQMQDLPVPTPGPGEVLLRVGGAAWREVIQALAPFGRMAICGATSGDAPEISIREIYQQHRRILGAPLGTRAEFGELVRCLAGGRLQPVVHATVPLDRIHDGLQMLAERDFFGKIAIQVEAAVPA
jgi:NADPH2:quinone reductase